METKKYYRHIRYTDDGCDMYQCLVCKKGWEVRYCGPNFCSYCGVQFDGELECRPADQPRWHYDRYGDYNKNQDVPNPWPSNRVEEPQWKVDWCLAAYHDMPDEEAQWSHEGNFPNYYKAGDIWHIVKEQLDDAYYSLIYRVRKGEQEVLFRSK